MVGRGFRLKPKLFQGQPTKDSGGALRNGHRIFTDVGPDPPSVVPSEQTP
jgi:hypothetical protein